METEDHKEHWEQKEIQVQTVLQEKMDQQDLRVHKESQESEDLKVQLEMLDSQDTKEKQVLKAEKVDGDHEEPQAHKEQLVKRGLKDQKDLEELMELQVTQEMQDQ